MAGRLAHLRGLATAIHEIFGLVVFPIDNYVIGHNLHQILEPCFKQLLPTDQTEIYITYYGELHQNVL